MRILKRILLLLLLLLIAFVAYTLISTGYFRKIKPMFDGKIIKKVAVVGKERCTGWI